MSNAATQFAPSPTGKMHIVQHVQHFLFGYLPSTIREYLNCRFWVLCPHRNVRLIRLKSCMTDHCSDIGTIDRLILKLRDVNRKHPCSAFIGDISVTNRHFSIFKHISIGASTVEAIPSNGDCSLPNWQESPCVQVQCVISVRLMQSDHSVNGQFNPL